MDPVRVLLIDDNPTFLRIATRFLNENNDGQFKVVGAIRDGNRVVSMAQDLRAEVILLDLNMPELPGLDIIPWLREAVPDAAIVVLSLMDATGYQQAALAAGAAGFVSKAKMSTDLLPAIRRATQPARQEPEHGARTCPTNAS